MSTCLAPWWVLSETDQPMVDDEVIGMWVTEDYPEIAVCIRVNSDEYIAFDGEYGAWIGCTKPSYWQPYLLSETLIREITGLVDAT